MAFTSFKNIDEVVTKYKLYYDVGSFISTVGRSERKPSPHLLETLRFNLNETVYDVSEAALCESIIYPVLQDIWKAYTKNLFLWSHTSIEADEDLTGVPDYLLAQKSEYGRVLGLPLLTTVEAKKDNFTEGWVQCAAQLIAMQKINAKKGKFILFGIVTNGEQWEFAQLDGLRLLKNDKAFSIFDLESLYSAIDTVFYNCFQQIK
jgi:hypothetical protein